MIMRATNARYGYVLCVLGLALGLLACKSAPEADGPSLPTQAELPAAVSPTPSAASDGPAAATAAPTSSTYDESVRSIEVAVGGSFVVALPANITTPMRWRIEPAPDTALLSVSETYADTPPPVCKGCAGYPGTRSFSFEAHAPGKLTLHFAYRPLTDPKAAAEQELDVQVNVIAK
jgi:predicted secreted protein